MATTVRLPSYARRRWPVVAIAVLVAGFILLSFLSNFYVDILWYREVGLSQVFWTRIWAQAGLAAAFFITFFALLLVNLYVTRRLAPKIVALTPEQEIVERFRENIEPYLRWALPLGAAVLALFVGLAASGHWQEFLLWRSSGGIAFGDPEAVFGRDPAFYVFTLPWLKYLQGWLFGALVGVTVIAGIGHFLQGGIRPQAVGLSDKVDPQVRAHLSVLLGLVLLAKAWGYWLGRFDLLTSERGVVHGASYTDVKAQLPALTFLTIVAVICAVALLRERAVPGLEPADHRRRAAPGRIDPARDRLSRVHPAVPRQRRTSSSTSGPTSEQNIAGTRRAFGLDEIRLEERPFESRVSAEDIEANETTVSNIRLWRPAVLKENFQSVQRIRQYYEFEDVDVDRYDMSDGQRRVLMVSGREVSQEGISADAQTWQNRHLVYTHGFGAVAAQVNSITADGAPVLTLEDIPPEGEPATEQPRIYYGEVQDPERCAIRGRELLDRRAGLRGSSGGDTVHLRRGRRDRARRHLPASPVRLALPGHEPPDLGPGHGGQPDPHQSKHRRARRRPPPVPYVRRRPLSGSDGEGVRLDLGRLHDVRWLSLLPVGGPVGGDGRPPRIARGELPAQLGEGGRRRVRRHHHLLRGPGRAHDAGVGPGIPRRLRADRRSVRRAAESFPVSGEPLPGAGLPLRELPRRRIPPGSTGNRTSGRSPRTRRSSRWARSMARPHPIRMHRAGSSCRATS